ncbi:MAG: polymer-forming cytoskeletal protein, partial [Bacteroidia bacterium]|nr:polymer-forming cytoskeletal protein [Bacteroidia bacterium]
MNIEILFLFIAFVILLFLPFLPACLELSQKKDARPLYINPEDTKDPNFWGKAISSLPSTQNYYLVSKEKRNSFPNFTNPNQPLEKKEEAEYKKSSPNISLIQLEPPQEVALITQDINSSEVHYFENLKAEDNLYVTTSLHIAQFLYVEGDCYIRATSHLGKSLYVAHTLYLQARCTFEKIFASAILIVPSLSLTKEIEYIEETNYSILYQKAPLISKNLLKLVNNNEDFLVIEGDIIAEKDIWIEGKIWVKGNIFSQQNITLGKGCVIGTKGKIKSVIANYNIQILGS